MKKNFWPYAIIGYFTTFAGGIVVWVTFALHHDDQLVRPDYYEHEIKYQDHIDKIVRTKALEPGVGLDYRFEDQSIIVSLPPVPEGETVSGSIQFYRPSDASLDLTIPIKFGAKTSQVDVSHLCRGYWKVRIDWSAAGKNYYFERPLVL